MDVENGMNELTWAVHHDRHDVPRRVLHVADVNYDEICPSLSATHCAMVVPEPNLPRR